MRRRALSAAALVVALAVGASCSGDDGPGAGPTFPTIAGGLDGEDGRVVVAEGGDLPEAWDPLECTTTGDTGGGAALVLGVPDGDGFVDVVVALASPFRPAAAFGTDGAEAIELGAGRPSAWLYPSGATGPLVHWVDGDQQLVVTGRPDRLDDVLAVARSLELRTTPDGLALGVASVGQLVTVVAASIPSQLGAIACLGPGEGAGTLLVAQGADELVPPTLAADRLERRQLDGRPGWVATAQPVDPTGAPVGTRFCSASWRLGDGRTATLVATTACDGLGDLVPVLSDALT